MPNVQVVSFKPWARGHKYTYDTTTTKARMSAPRLRSSSYARRRSSYTLISQSSRTCEVDYADLRLTSVIRHFTSVTHVYRLDYTWTFKQ